MQQNRGGLQFMAMSRLAGIHLLIVHIGHVHWLSDLQCGRLDVATQTLPLIFFYMVINQSGIT